MDYKEWHHNFSPSKYLSWHDHGLWMSSFVRQIVDSESWIFVEVVGRSRQVFAREHCFIKKVFIIMTNLFSCRDSGIQGISYYLEMSLIRTNTILDWSWDLILFQIKEYNTMFRYWKFWFRRAIFNLTTRCVCMVFVIHQGFFVDIFIKPRWITIITTNNCFMNSLTANYVPNGFVE